jgi:hypothetical protein
VRADAAVGGAPCAGAKGRCGPLIGHKEPCWLPPVLAGSGGARYGDRLHGGSEGGDGIGEGEREHRREAGIVGEG